MSNIIQEHEVNKWNQQITLEMLLKAMELLESKDVYGFQRYCYDQLFVIGFDWGGWDEGREFLKSDDLDFHYKDELFCYKLNTALLRNDRFCEGVLEYNISNGVIAAIFGRLIELKKD